MITLGHPTHHGEAQEKLEEQKHPQVSIRNLKFFDVIVCSFKNIKWK